ncbi:unnamed protein product [Leuciscus chuanchicus]
MHHIIYCREELLHIRRITADNLELFANIPEDILDVNNTGSPPWGNTSSTKRRRTGVVSRFRRRPYRPPLPALILSNVRSLKNKMDELLLLTQTDRNYSDCSAFCFTETWLDQWVPDEAVTPPGFTIFRADRSVKLSLKSKGGGISLMDIDVLESVCKALTPLADFTDGLSGEEHVSVSFLKPELQLFNEEVLKPEAEDSELTKTIKATVISSLNEEYDHAATDDLLNIQ